MKKIIFTLIVLSTIFQFSNGQTSVPQTNSKRILTPSMAGLGFYPADARHGALGEAGVATAHDQADMFWNPARTAFAETRFGFYSAYEPHWLKYLVNDMNFIHAGAYYKFKNNKSAISINYINFNYGLFQATDANGQSLGNFNSSEWALGINYAKKLSPNFSLGVGLKYMKSDLLSGLNINSIYGYQNQPATTIAADISIFHQDIDSTKLINLNYGIYIYQILVEELVMVV